jgi:hypothetical protein
MAKVSAIEKNNRRRKLVEVRCQARAAQGDHCNDKSFRWKSASMQP